MSREHCGPAHIGFQRTPEGLAQQRQFDSVAREPDLEKIERDYLKCVGEDGPLAKSSVQR